MSDDKLMHQLLLSHKEANETAVKAMNTVNELSGDIRELVTEFKYHKENNARLEEKIDTVDEKIDRYIPVLIKAESWQNARAKVLTGVSAAIIMAVIGYFYKF